MKQLNFRHFNTKKFFETVSFFQKEEKTGPKRPILFCFVYQGVFGHFSTTFISDFRRLPKISEDCRNFTKTNEEVRPLPKMSKEPSKHLTVLSSETANIKKLTNLTANTKNYVQITLNTKPNSDSLRIPNRLRRRVNSNVYGKYLLFFVLGGEKKKKHKSGAKRCKQWGRYRMVPSKLTAGIKRS